MRMSLLIAALMILVVGCAEKESAQQTKEPAMIAAPTNSPVRGKGIVGIDVVAISPRTEPITCVESTKTKTKNCSRHENNKSCNVPGDTIVWTWSSADTEQNFRIQLKDPDDLLFESSAPCEKASTTVTCKVKDDAEIGAVHEYAVIVDEAEEPIPDCNLDPLILIY